MALRTALTEMFGIAHPVVLAPMGGVAGGALAAAVSEGGGLGVIGAGSGDPTWLTRQCELARAGTHKPWGIGFLSWAIDAAVIDAAVAQSPAAIMLSFGDPAPFSEAVRAAGLPLIVQVTDLAEAHRALEVGADVVVAQGCEAGGHGGGRATLPFVPAVVDIAGSVPVLAAGGIADGRGLAAALVLGAAGAVIGTRFEATHEALISPEEADAIVAAGAADTTRGRALDVVRDSPWPARYPARTLRNAVTDAWQGRETDMNDAAKAAYRDGVRRRDLDYLPVWAGEAVDIITEKHSAATLVERIARDAEDAIATAGGRDG
ncbi:2-nitropropane dioxygenase [Mycobacteriaceae bacterium 1482268.1]|nr:2-nitropropane dioxygenase [Mycobacteriaceae bacterium 1482268.1]